MVPVGRNLKRPFGINSEVSKSYLTEGLRMCMVHPPKTPPTPASVVSDSRAGPLAAGLGKDLRVMRLAGTPLLDGVVLLSAGLGVACAETLVDDWRDCRDQIDIDLTCREWSARLGATHCIRFSMDVFIIVVRLHSAKRVQYLPHLLSLS